MGCDKEVELVEQLEKNGADASLIARTISDCTGHIHTTNQIWCLSQKEAALVDGLNPDASSADKLVALFQKW